MGGIEAVENNPISGDLSAGLTTGQIAASPTPAIGDLRQRLQKVTGQPTASLPTPAGTADLPRVRRAASSPPGTAPMSGVRPVVSPAVVPLASSIAPTRSSRMASLTQAIKSAVIMVVDDEKVNVLTVCSHLKRDGYTSFVPITDARQAMAALKLKKPDCLLLDINMPHVSGLELLRAKSNDIAVDHIPTIILTASTDPQVKVQALELGALDFLTKPVDPNELIPRVRNALFVKSHIDHVTEEAARLEALVQRRTAELYQSRQQLILSLARAAEHRDNETSNHVIRVGRFAGLIARQLGWPEEKAQMLEQAAQLHDVGKIGVPDAILFKPGKLDEQEYNIIKRHCAVGMSIIEPYSERDLEILRTHARLGSDIVHSRSSPMMMMASRIAQTHHERWDGTGYPLGLAGEDIPIEGRITAVADVYDALSTARPYKPAFPRQKCFQILTEGHGTQFDPTVLDAFFACSQEIIEVQLRFMDREPTTPLSANPG